MGQAPTVRVLNDVDETIHELSVRRERWGAWGIGADTRRLINYELRPAVRSKLRITEREELRDKTNRLYAASKSG